MVRFRRKDEEHAQIKWAVFRAYFKKIVFNQRIRTCGNYTHIVYKKKIKFDFGAAVP